MWQIHGGGKGRQKASSRPKRCTMSSWRSYLVRKRDSFLGGSVKVSAFSWKTIRERLATMDNLLIRGITDGRGGRCVFDVLGSNRVI